MQAQFPPQIASHSTVQEFYFGDDNLLRRHDYRVDVAGGFPAVQYVTDIVEADDIMPRPNGGHIEPTPTIAQCPTN